MSIKTKAFDATHIRTYSDSGKMIRSVETGVEYVDAVDPVESGRLYEEASTPIPAAQVL